MNAMRALWAAVEIGPRGLQRINGWLTVTWVAAVPVVLLVPGWKSSVTLLVFISIYANIAGHFAGWQAARVEVRQEEQAEDG